MNVMTQYLVPIQAGMVNDVDAAIDDFIKRAENAGWTNSTRSTLNSGMPT